jgi:hypothetical protein
MPIPTDLVDELQRELSDCCDELAREAERLGRLVELHRLAVLVSLRLGRRITVVDLFEALGNERGLVSLFHSLRGRGRDQ